ncbi:MAG TPA: hypothetical protein VHL79_03330, partial [Ramlibacter sp.]|nr:hypothetical protein [Ramlibacter sp.]
MTQPFVLSGPALQLPRVLTRSLELLPDGGLVSAFFVYRDTSGDPLVNDGQDFYVRRFDADATPAPGDRMVATTGWQVPTPAWYRPFRDPEATVMQDGKVLFTWRLENNIYFGISPNSPGQNPDLYSAIYDPATHTVTPPALFPTALDANVDSAVGTVASLHAVERLSDGKLVMVSTAYGGNLDALQDIKLTLMDAGGSVLRSAIVNVETFGYQSQPAVTVLPQGFVVLWTDHAAAPDDASGTAVRARLFDNEGQPLTDAILVNTTTVGEQGVAVAADLPGGGFVVTWQQATPIGEPAWDWEVDVRMQRFAADGSKLGPEALVSTTTSGRQNDTAVHSFSDGSFLVVWNHDMQAIRGRYFDAAGAAIGDEFQVGTTTEYNPRLKITEAADARLLVTWGISYGGTGSGGQ